MIVNIYLVRHAESVLNVSLDNRIGGRSVWAPLTDDGVEQALETGRFFKEVGIEFDAVYCSTSRRTADTATMCLKGMDIISKIIFDDELLEMDQGDWEGISRDIYKRDDVKIALDSDNWNFIPGDIKKGESKQMVANRMQKWIDNQIAEFNKTINDHNPKNILVFTHGLAIKCLLAELLNLDRKTAYLDAYNPINNASITLLQYKDGNLVLPLKIRNYVEHLHK